MKHLVAYIWKLPLCAAAHTLGVMLGGSVALAIGATLPAISPEAEPGRLALAAARASLTLGLGLAPLATDLESSFALRAGILAWLGFVCLGINTAVEAAIYTTVGRAGGIVVMNLFAAAACAIAVAALFQPVAASATWKDSLWHFVRQWGTPQWALRLFLAVLACPLAYFTFGMLVGPYVVDAYRSTCATRSGASTSSTLPWRNSTLAESLALEAFDVAAHVSQSQGVEVRDTLRRSDRARLCCSTRCDSGTSGQFSGVGIGLAIQ